VSGALAPDATRAEALRRAEARLAAGGIAGAGREARLLALEALACTPLDLALRGDAPCGAGAARLAAWLARRLAGEPVARILGAWEFWGLPFRLSPDTLVPRPDSETAVEAALAALPERLGTHRLLDLGTGSGCLLVALLHERPGAFGVGLDLSEGALVTARENARANGVGTRTAFVRGNWGAALAGPFDLVIANPPYIASGTIAALAPEVRGHDPHAALDGGPDGLDAYRTILAEAPRLLAPGKHLVLEIGHDQGETVPRLVAEAGLLPSPVRRDLAGNPRVALARRAP
jgi:release factor glutamine methyltransferase